jgi:hypothetical protein
MIVLLLILASIFFLPILVGGVLTLGVLGLLIGALLALGMSVGAITIAGLCILPFLFPFFTFLLGLGLVVVVVGWVIGKKKPSRS